MAKQPNGRFTYQRRSKESVRERANMRGGGFDSIFKPQFKLYKMRDGKNIIRILPPTWEGAAHYGYDIYVNYGIGVDEQSYLSLSKMLQEKDPIAEARRVAQQEGDKKLESALQPRQRIAMWVIDRQDEDEGPQILPAPFTWDKSLLNISFDDDTKEVVYVDDPEEGCDVRFYKEGAGLKTKYDASKMKLLAPSPLCEDEKLQAEWLEFAAANPIPDCLNFYDYDHIAQVFGGQARTDEGDEDAQPRRGRAAQERDSNPRGRPGRGDEVEEEPEAPPPRRRRPDPEPDPEPDHEDDEAPPPRRGGKPAELGPEDEPPRGASSIRERLRNRSAARGGRADPEE